MEARQDNIYRISLSGKKKYVAKKDITVTTGQNITVTFNEVTDSQLESELTSWINQFV